MLCHELERTDGIELITVFNRRRGRPAAGGVGSLRNLAADTWWAIELTRLARRARAEVIHHPLPARAVGAGIAQVLTVHDLSFERLPGCFDRGFRVYAHLTHRASARAADVVICVSETTAADAAELWSIDGRRIVVAPHGPGQRVVPPPGQSPHPHHFLYVGDAEPRKNLGTLLSAYRGYRERADWPVPLILAGDVPDSLTGAETGIWIERDMTRRRLAELYATSVALIQPSLYEGFGLTALEAMSAGAPVIAARSPGLTETCAGAVLWIDPRDPRTLSAAMLSLSGQPPLREELIARGRARAAEFSWSSCARAHVTAYSLALARGREPPMNEPPA